MQRLFIISGCNGAGKTTASYTVLPEILSCKEFVNADEIAKGLSPFNPESVAIEAGKIMIRRLLDLFSRKQDFAFETTLATRSYAKLIKQAQNMGYVVTLLYFWLESPQLAVERVAQRVREGGHNIHTDVIYRRYKAGIKNLFDLYIPICDNWSIINSSDLKLETIAEGNKDLGATINNPTIFKKIQNYE